MKSLLFIVFTLALASTINAKRSLNKRFGKPLACPSGTSNRKSGSGWRCVDCPRGTFRTGVTTSSGEKDGRAPCLPCSPGTTSPARSTSAAACVVPPPSTPSGGTPSSTPPSGGGGGGPSSPSSPGPPAGPPAAPCAAGTGRTVLANGSISTSCAYCPTGTFNDGSLATCTNCSSVVGASTTKGVGAKSSADCTCPSGTSPNTAANSTSGDGCVCAKGTGWAPVYLGAVITGYSCQPCSQGNTLVPGTYNDGSTLHCTLCNNGSTTTVAGAASCDVCFPGSGFSASSQQCTPCPANQINPGNSKTCSPCPSVSSTSYAIVATSQQDSCQCNRGTLAPNGTSCISPPGFGWSVATAVPVACLGNTYNAGDNLFCILCPKGQTANSAKTQCTCPAGTGMTAAGGSSCVSCASLGTRWNNGSSPTCLGLPTFDATVPGGSATTGVSLDNSQPTCGSGVGWVWSPDGTKGACVACPSSKFNDGSYFTCQSCPTGTLPTSPGKPAFGKPQCTCDGTLTPTQGYSFATGVCSTCQAGTFIAGTLGCTPCAPGAFCGTSTLVDVRIDAKGLNNQGKGSQAKFTSTTVNYGICTSSVATATDVSTITASAVYGIQDFGVRAQDLTLGVNVFGDNTLKTFPAVAGGAAAVVANGVAAGATGITDPGRWSTVGAKTAADCYCLLDGTQTLDAPIPNVPLITDSTKKFVQSDLNGNIQLCQECTAGTNNTINGLSQNPVLGAAAIPSNPSPKCKPCPKGYYQSLAGQALCVACPQGSTTSGTQLATGPQFCAA